MTLWVAPCHRFFEALSLHRVGADLAKAKADEEADELIDVSLLVQKNLYCRPLSMAMRQGIGRG